jgi:hypothetical protein
LHAKFGDDRTIFEEFSSFLPKRRWKFLIRPCEFFFRPTTALFPKRHISILELEPCNLVHL